MRKKFTVLSGILLFIAGYGYTQTLPNVKPPPPSAMQFQKYGDYPVSHFTGIPNITIPLYTIKEGDLEVPITLSFHPSGFRPGEVDGSVGYGWVLNVGGQISRTIYDVEDEQTISTLTNNMPRPSESYVTNLLTNLGPYGVTYLNQIETEFHYDIFSFDFLGKHGKYIMKDHNLNTFELLDYQPLAITAVYNSPHIASFTIKDETGKRYFFGVRNWEYGADNSDYWNLSSIRSAMDTTNEITYTYVNGPTNTFRSRTDTYIRDDNEQEFDLGVCDELLYESVDYWSANVFTELVDNGTLGRVPQQINFRNGHVQFVYDGVSKMLTAMEIYNGSNELLQKYRFEHYRNNPAGGETYYFLKKVKLYDQTDNFVNQYSFNYHNETEYVPDTEIDLSVDYWGYYNMPQGIDLIPRFFIQFYNSFGNMGSSMVGPNYRRSDEEKMKMFQLNEIIYPTGGRTIFQYEANRYAALDGSLPTGYNLSGLPESMVGGLRIKRILNYSDSNILSTVKDYEYLISRMDVIPSRQYFTRSETRYFVGLGSVWPSYRRVYVSSDPVVNITPHGSPVVYPLVKEHIRKVLPGGGIDEGAANSLTTTYEYDYERFEEYGFSETNGLEEVYTAPLYPAYVRTIKAMTDGKLTRVTYEGPNTNTSVEYEYEKIVTGTFYTFYSTRNAYYDVHPCAVYVEEHPDQAFYNDGGATTCHLNYGDVSVEPVNKRLKYIYHEGQGVTTETEFIYANSTHNLPTLKIITNSKGEEIKTILQYPHEMQSEITPNVYNAMVSRHIWSPVIQESNYKVGSPDVFLQSTNNNFDFWENNAWTTGSASSLIVPRTVQTTVGPGSPETRVRFHAYDNKANVVSVAKEADLKMSYIWGYNQSFPIAEVANAESKDIFHTSFEEESGGNIAAEGKTGKKSRTGGYTKNLANLTNGSYILSYWQKSGGNWTPFSTPVTVATNSYTINIAGQVDEVRFYPSGALMTTLTYDPLVGMTSETNSNNQTVYYEYDPALRLMHVLDEDKNVIKKYSYSFHNSTTAPSTDPNWQNAGQNYCEPCNINPAFNSGYRMVEQTDNNSNSYTFGQTRVTRVLDNTCGTVSNYWQNTSNYRCVTNGGINTGEQERQQIFTNPCYTYEYYFQQTRWVSVGTNTTACPVPSFWYNQDLSGNYTKDNCPEDYAGTEVYVSVPPGMFSSSTSLNHANQLGWQYAQGVANSSASCTPVPFMLQCDNQTIDDIEITLSDPVTHDILYTFVVDGGVSGYQDLGNILPGTYDVRFLNLDYPIPYYYCLACCTVTDDGYNITVPDVTIGSSCNTIEIYY